MFINTNPIINSRPLDNEELEKQEITHNEKINTKDTKPFPQYLGSLVDVYV